MIEIREATEADVPLILGLIRELADFEKLGHEVTADEATLRRNLFTERRSAEVLLAERGVADASAERGVADASGERGVADASGERGAADASGERGAADASGKRAVVGVAIFFHNFSTFMGKPGLYLEDLYVKPEARGEGVGMALLRRLAQIAVERDCGRMEWWVLDWNRKAIDLYLKLGARPMDEWTVFRLRGSELRALAHGEESDSGE